MNYVLSILLTISFLSTSLSFIDNNLPNNCKTAIEEAKKDYANNSLKYYTFGIASFSKKEVKMNVGPKIEVVSLGCMISTHQICYNQYVDSLLVSKTGLDFHSLSQ